MSNIYRFEVTSLEKGVVDRENGIVRGVSVITAGVEAKGHKLHVDKKTLQQMHELAEEKGQVPVKWNHGSGADAVNGFLTNFRIEGNKLKADWHLLKTHEKFDQALELAERMPENVGFSTSFAGQPELEDGTKVHRPDDRTKTHYTMQRGARVPVPKDAVMLARCTDLVSVDLVATPAANPDGMFEVMGRIQEPEAPATVDTVDEGMAEKPTPGSTPENQEDASKILLGEFRQFAASVNERLTRLEQGDDDDDDDADDDEGGEGAEGGEEFGSVAEVLNYFESRLDAMTDEREKREFAAAQAELEHRFEQLVELNEQLAEQNQFLALAYKELSAKTKNVVEFSPGKEGEEPRVVVRATNGKKLTEFEKRVEELKRDGKSPAEAMIFAVDEDVERYQAHLEAKGAITHSL